MNERLHELARQAKIEFTLDPTERPIRAFVECWEDELAKFAELIIRECCKVSDEIEPLELSWKTSRFVKLHFGIEE